MNPPDERTPAQKLRIALDMFAIGEAIQLQNLRREFPNASEGELAGLLAKWRCTRPGAENGDAVGRSVNRFRNPP